LILLKKPGRLIQAFLFATTMGKTFFVKEQPEKPVKKAKAEEEVPEDSKENRLAKVEEILAFVKLQFQPAKSLPEADFTLTTREVYDRLQKHYPSGLYGRKDVFDLLSKLGYTYAIVNQVDFHWLFKEVREA
jgi:hypothetical protein